MPALSQQGLRTLQARGGQMAGAGTPGGAIGSAEQYLQGGQVVPVTPDIYGSSFLNSGAQAAFIHPQTGQWVPFSQLPIGANGQRMTIAQPDGMPLVNRGVEGGVGPARLPTQSALSEFAQGALPVLAAAAPVALSAFAPAAAGTAAATTAGTAAAAPEIGAGLFAGGVEQAALGTSPGLLGTVGSGAASAAPLTMAGTGAASFAAPAVGAAGGGGMASGLMSWLGSPAAQAAGQLANAGLQAYAGQRASQQQASSAQAGIEEQRRQFEATRQALTPFAQAGTQALGGFAPYQAAGLQAFQQQQALAGLQGQQAQRAAIGALEASPEYQALARQGEEAILQRASATGGLRGGNVQAALAQFRPAMLQQLIDQQYQRLGGFAGTGLNVTGELTRMGQSAAGQTGQFGAGTASNIGNLLAAQGQAQAGGTLGMARGISQALNIPATMQQYEAGRDLFRT